MEKMDTKKLIAEEIVAERERREDTFKRQVRDRIRAIGAIQEQIVGLQAVLSLSKKELKELSFEPLDETIYQ